LAVRLGPSVALDRDNRSVGPDLGHDAHMTRGGGGTRSGPELDGVAGRRHCARTEVQTACCSPPVDIAGERVSGYIDAPLVPYPGGEQSAPLLARSVRPR
jgi:hypothetical protein